MVSIERKDYKDIDRKERNKETKKQTRVKERSDHKSEKIK